MKIEKKSFQDYWSEIGRIFGIQDTIKMVAYYPDEYLDPIEGWEEYDEVIEFRNSCRELLSKFNIDKQEAFYV